MANYLDTVGKPDQFISRLELFAEGGQDTMKSAGIRRQIYGIRAGIAVLTLIAISTIAYAVLLGITTSIGISVCLAASIPLAAIYLLSKKSAKLTNDFAKEITNYLVEFKWFFSNAYKARCQLIEGSVQKQADGAVNDDQVLTVPVGNLEHQVEVGELIHLAESIKKLGARGFGLAKEFKELKQSCDLFLNGIGTVYSKLMTSSKSSLIKPVDYISFTDRLIYNFNVLERPIENKFKTTELLVATSKLDTERRTWVILTISTVALAALGAIGIIFNIYFFISVGLLAAASVPFLAFFIRRCALHYTIWKEEKWVVAELNKRADKFQEFFNSFKKNLESHVETDKEKWTTSNFKEKMKVILQEANWGGLMWPIIAEGLIKQEPINTGSKFDAPFNRLLSNAKLFVYGDPTIEKDSKTEVVPFYSENIKASDDETLVLLSQPERVVLDLQKRMQR